MELYFDNEKVKGFRLGIRQETFVTTWFCVSALESADTNFSPAGSSDRDLLSDVPNLKKTLYLLQHDLVRVQRMAAYHR